MNEGIQQSVGVVILYLFRKEDRRVLISAKDFLELAGVDIDSNLGNSEEMLWSAKLTGKQKKNELENQKKEKYLFDWHEKALQGTFTSSSQIWY